MDLPNIPNASPVTADATSLWVNNVFVQGKRLNAQLVPYDRAKGLLVLGTNPVRVSVADTTADAGLKDVLPAVVAEMRRQGIAAKVLPEGDASAVVDVRCFAPQPGRPILLIATFGDAKVAPLKQVRVNDCEKLAAADPVFGGVFASALGAIISKVPTS